MGAPKGAWPQAGRGCFLQWPLLRAGPSPCPSGPRPQAGPRAQTRQSPTYQAAQPAQCCPTWPQLLQPCPWANQGSSLAPSREHHRDGREPTRGATAPRDGHRRGGGGSSTATVHWRGRGGGPGEVENRSVGAGGGEGRGARTGRSARQRSDSGSVLGGSWGCWGSSVGGRGEAARAPSSARTRDARALGSRKHTGHAAHVAGPEGTWPLCSAPQPQAHARPSWLLHFCGCHRPRVPSSSLHRGGAALRERSGAGCPSGQRSRRGEVRNRRVGRPRAPSPTPDKGGLGQHGDRAPPTCPRPGSLLGGLASSHLPASGAPGPLVSAPWGPVILAGGHLGLGLLRGPLLGLAAPLLPAGHTLLLLLGRQSVLAPVFGGRVC